MVVFDSPNELEIVRLHHERKEPRVASLGMSLPTGEERRLAERQGKAHVVGAWPQVYGEELRGAA